jgi:hypothetical protein
VRGFVVRSKTSEAIVIEILSLGGAARCNRLVGAMLVRVRGIIETFEVVMFGNGQIRASALPICQRESFFNLLRDNPQTFHVGDYNRDGTVDEADYVVWRDSMNDTILIDDRRAEGNRDGIVNLLEYEVWKMNFGSSSEPPFLALIILPAIAVATWQWRLVKDNPAEVPNRIAQP